MEDEIDRCENGGGVIAASSPDKGASGSGT